MSTEPIVHAEPAEIDADVLARAEAMAVALVVLPVRHVNGLGVYSQTSVLFVKQLRAAGLSAEFLDPPESRTFEVKKSAFTTVIMPVVLGIGSSAAWDAIKAIFRSRSAEEKAKLSVTYVDLDRRNGQRGAAWKVEGDSDAVLQAIDKLRSAGHRALAGHVDGRRGGGAVVGVDEGEHQVFPFQPVRGVHPCP
jgi:hypothetical protein